MEKQLLEFKEKYESRRKEEERKSNQLSRVRILLFFAFLLLVIFYSNQPSNWIIALLWVIAFIFAFVALYHNQVNKKKRKYEIYVELIEKYEMRRTEKWKSLKSEEIEVEDSALLDLGVFGKNSLFQFLNFTSSLGGRRKLIDTLSLKKVMKKNILENQEAIKELQNNFEFVLSFQEKLTHVKNIEKIDFKEYYYFFDKEKKSKKIELVISTIFSFLTILTFLLACFQILSFMYFAGLFFFQLASTFLYTSIYREEFDEISKCVRIFSWLGDTYHYMESVSFHSKKNKSLQDDIRKGRETLNHLNKISTFNSYRFNLITNLIFNIFFSLNYKILYQYTELLKKENNTFKRSIDALEEMEVLISLSTVAFVKEELVFPILEDNISLEMKNIKHPLLEEKACIENDFQCSQDIQIITGSNMSGKTSFMRTIGINLVLAYAGTYVNASKFSCTIMKIFTSINVKDDIGNGISTFYGELKRIKAVLDFNKEKNMPMIVFIDEIFKGTNYNDRIIGAKEVLKKLSNLPCIVFLTTHDFELCEINNKKIHNYHFEETYQKNKIFFDYKIKNGQCKTTNAKYLMKEIGIID